MLVFAHSVRGYGYGELGAARRFLETALEARVPLRNFGLPGIAYAFTEYGTDLSSARGLEVGLPHPRVWAMIREQGPAPLWKLSDR